MLKVVHLPALALPSVCLEAMALFASRLPQAETKKPIGPMKKGKTFDRLCMDTVDRFMAGRALFISRPALRRATRRLGVTDHEARGGRASPPSE